MGSTVETWNIHDCEFSINRHIFQTFTQLKMLTYKQNFKHWEIQPAIDQWYPGYCLSQLLSIYENSNEHNSKCRGTLMDQLPKI
jgi:hypothetical protein